MYDKIKKILVDEMNIKESNITLDSELTGDLGFNSLELADLVMLCEEKFGISFDDDDLSKLITVRDVVEYIESKQ
ncbi:MAG: acyl carrier protein [Clostridiales bacterium]|nr:acyl carrier protein [Clostridiales bacterium]